MVKGHYSLLEGARGEMLDSAGLESGETGTKDNLVFMYTKHVHDGGALSVRSCI